MCQPWREFDVYWTFIDDAAAAIAVPALEKACYTLSAAGRTAILDRDPKPNTPAIVRLFPRKRDLNVDVGAGPPGPGLRRGVWAGPRTAKEILDERKKRGFRE
jgi:hypothetical protein